MQQVFMSGKNLTLSWRTEVNPAFTQTIYHCVTVNWSSMSWTTAVNPAFTLTIYHCVNCDLLKMV